MSEELTLSRQSDVPIRSKIYQTAGIFIAGISILWGLISLPWASTYIIDPLSLSLAWITTTLLNLFGESVHQIGVFVNSPAVNLEITPACTGIYQIVVLIAGIVAWSGTVREGWRGVAIGTLILMGFNIVRIISIYYSALIIPRWVPFLHEVFWEAVMVLLIPVFWMYWVKHMSGNPPKRIA
jgi:exosortase/archaeosortase family protein